MGLFSFFQSETHKDLEQILLRLKLNAENNYRDATKEDLAELEAKFNELHDAGKLSEKQITYYNGRIAIYKEKLKNFSHKAQKVGNTSSKI